MASTDDAAVLQELLRDAFTADAYDPAGLYFGTRSGEVYGSRDDGETWEEAALREVCEETGCEARVVSFAGSASWFQRRSPRLALYWHMALVHEEPFEETNEVDALEWLAPADALQRLDLEAERVAAGLVVAHLGA